jgi:ATP-dependent RNA helicase DDX51/DBP6
VYSTYMIGLVCFRSTLAKMSESEQAALPSFPLPSIPNPPPKSLLALQGLDQALVDAEIVDPGILLPLDEHDAGSRLSELARKRLKELGITELFAGKFFLAFLARFNYVRC